MALKLITQPAIEPVSVEDIKLHLRVDNNIEDVYIAGLGATARWWAERFQRRAYITQTWLLALDRWPGANDYYQGFWDYGVMGDAALGLGVPPVGYTFETKSEVFFRAGQIILPFSPLQSIDSIKYLDSNGVLQTLNPTAYQIDNISEPGRLAPSANSMWPLTQISVRAPIMNSVQIQYKVGYGDTADMVPPPVAHAIKVLVGHWYENREEVITGPRAVAVEVSMTARALLWMDRIYRVA